MHAAGGFNGADSFAVSIGTLRRVRRLFRPELLSDRISMPEKVPDPCGNAMKTRDTDL